MTTVALDASALMAPVELDLRVFDELDRLLEAYDLVVPDAVIEELERLAASTGEEGRAARVASDLSERCRIVETNKHNGDDALVELAREGAIEYVVTTDRPLRDRVLDTGTPVIEARGRNTLAITEP